MTANGPEKGDKVSWNWGGGAPGGTVAETKDEGEIAIKSKRGNTIKKNASPDNPAVHVERSGNDVVKRASELTVEKKASKNNKKESEEESDGGSSGNKRKAENQEDLKADINEEEHEAEEVNDTSDVHTINKQGKEVKRGGKEANKRQRIQQGTDVKGNTDDSDASENEPEEEANKTEDEEENVEDAETDEMKAEEDIEEKDEGDGDDDNDERENQVNANKKSGNARKGKTQPNKRESKGKGKSSGQSKNKAKPNSAPREGGDQISTRTRSQKNAA
ncbi:hypothetical protein F4678DRAFT_467393 [Xylaria arbuscula]|nr:hypothetical protein F4678DRAFT_467393 [Xylaria arbuscula]